MAEQLKDVKDRVSKDFLGRGGIHGVGVRRARNAICVYLDLRTTPDQDAVLKELTDAAAPYPVVVVREERPSTT